MARLTKKQKEWIVDRLACFEGPTDVAQAFAKEFKAEIDKAQVANYNGAKKGPRQRMAKELVALFDETRDEYRTETRDIAIASKAHRLRRLDTLARAAKSPSLEASLMEQAAKEVGEAYTNRHVVDARVVGTGLTLSPDDLRAEGVDLDKLVQGYFALGREGGS